MTGNRIITLSVVQLSLLIHVTEIVFPHTKYINDTSHVPQLRILQQRKKDEIFHSYIREE